MVSVFASPNENGTMILKIKEKFFLLYYMWIILKEFRIKIFYSSNIVQKLSKNIKIFMSVWFLTRLQLDVLV